MKEIPRKPYRRRPKVTTFERRVFAADVAIAGAHVTLTMRRGGHVRTLAADGEALGDRFVADAKLRVDPTARLLLCGPDPIAAPDAVASLTVLATDLAYNFRERYRCLFVSGKVDAAAREGHVLFAGYPVKHKQLELAPPPRSPRASAPRSSVLGSLTFPDASSSGRARHLSDDEDAA